MSQPRGQILIIINILTSVLLIYSLALVNLTITARNIEKKEDYKLISKNIAEAGIQQAIWCFNQTEGTNCGGTYGSDYSGGTDIGFGQGIFDIAITAIDANTKQIEATGYYPNKTNILAKSTIKTKIATDANKASFNYGAQIGAGGLEMGSGAIVNGSVYSNGDITGSSGAQITGDAYVAGGTALTSDQQHTVYNSDFIFAKTNPQIDIAQSFIPGTSDVLNKISLYIKKISSPYDIEVKIAGDDSGEPDDDSILASATLTSSIVSANYGWIDVAFTSPPSLTSGTKYWIILDAKESSSKYWTVGIDAFDNYAGGTMLYSEDWDDEPWTSSGYDINFKTWLGGVETGISNITVGGNAYAHSMDSATVSGNAEIYKIENSTIGGDALADSITGSTINQHATCTDISDSTVGSNLWCQTYSNTNVGGTISCPFSVIPPTDPGPAGLPISDALINDWKADAAAGGIIEGDYTIIEDSSLGPKKINGNLTVNNNVTLTLTGVLYVTGTIALNNGSSIILDSLFGSESSMVISDNIITIYNNVSFSGAGTGSYLMLISAWNDTVNSAINVSNNTTAAILLAPYGIIDVTNNAALKQVNAYKLKLSNNVALNYETGLSNISFSSGPSGGWSELKGHWQIVN